MKIIKSILFKLVLAVVSYCTISYIPYFWGLCTSSMNSIAASLYFMFCLVLSSPVCFLAFLLILDLETLYKKFHKYDPHKRKWVRK